MRLQGIVWWSRGTILTKKNDCACVCVCSGEVCWRKCVKYVCHIRFDIEFLNQNCLRLLSWLWCAHCLQIPGTQSTHPFFRAYPLKWANKLYCCSFCCCWHTFYRHFSNPIKTFSIFSILLIFDPSSFIYIQIKYQNLSHNGIKYKLLIPWKWYIIPM